MKIGVIGGLTMDLFYNVNKLPQKGQTIEVKNYFLSPGGKALNISTAIKRFGEDVSLIGSVGKDALSEEIFEKLLSEKINTEGLLIQEDIQTDLITVIVTPDGIPSFIGTRAANYYLTPQDIDRLEYRISKLKTLIITMEIPNATVKRALEIAREYKVSTILKPSPSDEFTSDLLRMTDYLILNGHEALVCSNKQTAPEQMKFFLKKGAKYVIITNEQTGCDFWNGEKVINTNLYPKNAVDFTASESTFCGVFIAAISSGIAKEKAILLASHGAALTAQRHGSGLIIPTKQEIEEFFEK